MKIEITPEMLEEARKKREAEKHLVNSIADDGADGDNICIACQ